MKQTSCASPALATISPPRTATAWTRCRASTTPFRRTATTIGSATNENHTRTCEWAGFPVHSGYADQRRTRLRREGNDGRRGTEAAEGNGGSPPDADDSAASRPRALDTGALGGARPPEGDGRPSPQGPRVGRSDPGRAHPEGA